MDRPATFAALAACLSCRLLAGPVKAGALTGWRRLTASAICWVADRSRTSQGSALRLLRCSRSHQYFSSIGRCAPAWIAGASRTLSSLRLDRACGLASLGFRSPSTPPTLPATPLADAELDVVEKPDVEVRSRLLGADEHVRLVRDRPDVGSRGCERPAVNDQRLARCGASARDLMPRPVVDPASGEQGVEGDLRCRPIELPLPDAVGLCDAVEWKDLDLPTGALADQVEVADAAPGLGGCVDPRRHRERLRSRVEGGLAGGRDARGSTGHDGVAGSGRDVPRATGTVVELIGQVAGHAAGSGEAARGHSPM